MDQGLLAHWQDKYQVQRRHSVQPSKLNDPFQVKSS